MIKQILFIYIGLPAIALIICASQSKGYVEPKYYDPPPSHYHFNEENREYNTTLTR